MPFFRAQALHLLYGACVACKPAAAVALGTGWNLESEGRAAAQAPRAPRPGQRTHLDAAGSPQPDALWTSGPGKDPVSNRRQGNEGPASQLTFLPTSSGLR